MQLGGVNEKTQDAEENEEAVRDRPTDSSSCEGEDSLHIEERADQAQEQTDQCDMFDDHVGDAPADSSCSEGNIKGDLHQTDREDVLGQGEPIKTSEGSQGVTVSRKRTTSKNTEKKGWSGEAHALHVNRTENKRGGRLVFIAFYQIWDVFNWLIVF